MSPAGRSDPIRWHLQLAWAFAEILTRDVKRAEGLFREAMLEAKVRMDAADRKWPRHRLLAAIRDVYYRGEHRPGHDGHDGGAVCGRAMSTTLGHAVDVLPDEDRELLFLRFGAELNLSEIARISGRVPAVARARIVELCAALQGRMTCPTPVMDTARSPAPTIH